MRMLLDLPPELIQLVLQNCNPPDFLEAAFSCRTLFQIASTCREVLLDQLNRTPGPRSGLQSLKSKQLFSLFLKRAAQELYGTQFHANCTTFHPGTEVLDVRASSLASSDDGLVALVLKGQENVHLFRIVDGLLHFHNEFTPFFEQPGAVEVLKTAFDQDDGLYILQRFIPSINQDDTNAEHPFVKQALESNSKGQIFLSRHSVRSCSEPVQICTFPDHSEYEPLALAAADRGTFAISWQHAHAANGFEVLLYTTATDSTSNVAPKTSGFSYNSYILVDQDRQRLDNERYLDTRLTRTRLPAERGPIVDLSFNDRSSQLLYFYKGRTLYGSFQRINSHSLATQPTLYDNSCLVQFSNNLSLLFSIAIPFFGTHRTDPWGVFDICQWKYLAFGIATHREEDWTIACLLMSETSCSSQTCGHVLNLDRGRRFPHWKIVARLWGFRDSTNSLGCIVAGSRAGTRVALVNWNILYIWSLDPDSLINENTDDHYPPSWRSPTSDMIELRPISLPLDAVCFKLRFTGEDELQALTDRGLMCWDLSPLGKGQRISRQLNIKGRH